MIALNKELFEKCEKFVKIKSQGWDNLKGIEVKNEWIYITYGYLGQGSTTLKTMVSLEGLEDFING